MLIPLLSIVIRDGEDVVAARQRARQLASLVGFGTQDQVRIATAVSEIARNAYQHGGGRAEFALALTARPQALTVTVHDKGPGMENIDAVLNGTLQPSGGGGLGLIGSRRLMDSFEIQTKPGQGTTVQFSKFLPEDAPKIRQADVASLVARFTQERLPTASVDELQNRDLLETLDALRLRELELEKRHSEMRRINSELEETNRGVVALYAELEEKAAALRQADELKGRFLRHVSHEFRTPLNSILALARLLLQHTDGDLSSEQERQVGYIRKAAEDLTEIVNDLLDLAKVEAGKTEVRIRRIDLVEMFGTLRGVMRPLVSSDTVTLVFEEPPENIAFESDEAKIAQILRNLISNALKFTERGEVRVSCGVENGWLSLSVTDTGIGIADEDQSRIFHEFAQVDNAIQGRVKGTGLGLPLSRKLAALLGGELTVASAAGKGAKFTLRLPAESATTALPGYAQAESDSILIIDDEEADRYIVHQRFRGTRYRIIEAPNGVEGAERARFERPVLILLDLTMPGRNGFEVLEDLKRDAATRDIPVLIHTSRRLGQADYERLGNRHTGILPKGEVWPSETLSYIRGLLGEPHLFAGEWRPELSEH